MSSELNRDLLAELVGTLRVEIREHLHEVSNLHEESTSLADVRVEIAALNGTIGTLAEAVRLQVDGLARANRETVDDHHHQRRRQEAADAKMDLRVTRIEELQWKVAAFVGFIGIISGGVGSSLAERALS